MVRLADQKFKGKFGAIEADQQQSKPGQCAADCSGSAPPELMATGFVGTLKTDCGTVLTIRDTHAAEGKQLWVHPSGDQSDVLPLYNSHAFHAVRVVAALKDGSVADSIKQLLTCSMQMTI